MSGLPRSIRVMGQRFTVQQFKELHVEELDGTKAEDVIGVCDIRQNAIGLLRSVGNEHKRATFLHECLHAMVSATGISIDHNQAAEEAIVKRLAPVLMQFIRDNPAAISYILETA